jgi:hypothetical protein
MRGIWKCPSGGGVGTARGIARAYGVFAAGGQELGLRPETFVALTSPADPSRHGFYDECVKGEAQFSLGFADPQTGIGYAYVTNRMGAHLAGDPREVALREAVTSCVRGAARAFGRPFRSRDVERRKS